MDRKLPQGYSSNLTRWSRRIPIGVLAGLRYLVWESDSGGSAWRTLWVMSPEENARG